MNAKDMAAITEQSIRNKRIAEETEERHKAEARKLEEERLAMLRPGLIKNQYDYVLRTIEELARKGEHEYVFEPSYEEIVPLLQAAGFTVTIDINATKTMYHVTNYVDDRYETYEQKYTATVVRW
mgnify:CR=1 FL=1